MRWVVLVVVCGACSYAPARLDGDDPPGDGSTDSALDGPPGDPDNDGVPTAIDNCPTVANASQHDEDDDAIGDACDPCPQLTGPTSSADSDGDGIGDGCDPRPSVADQLVYFEPFDGGAGLPAGWNVISGNAGNWTIADDRLVNDAGEVTSMIVYDIGAGSHTIDLGIEITAVNITTDTTGVGALIDDDGGTADFYMCFASTLPSNRFTLGYGPGSITFQEAFPGPVFPNRYRIVTSYEGTQLHCRFAGPNAPATLTTTQASLGNTHVGIRTRNTAVRIEYVAVYRSP